MIDIIRIRSEFNRMQKVEIRKNPIPCNVYLADFTAICNVKMLTGFSIQFSYGVKILLREIIHVLFEFEQIFFSRHLFRKVKKNDIAIFTQYANLILFQKLRQRLSCGYEIEFATSQEMRFLIF